ncbi:hypothetical protein EC991_004612 [Linnemannia zychae]|nr:hypothetical protein EC991_004612 [Linnemannia zychae]
MQPSATTFFSIMELMELLSAFLDLKALARLSATSSVLDAACSPILWRYFNYRESKDSKQKQVRIEQLKALARRGHHTRSFHTDALILVLYVNGISGTQEDPLTLTRPPWLPAPKAQSTLEGVRFSSMTRLTRIVCSLFTNGFKDPAEGIKEIPSFDSSNKFRQLCWLIELNPYLINVTLSALEPKTSADNHILACAIASLSRLKNLRVEYFASIASGPWIEGLKTLFFACPVSLQSLELKTYHTLEPLPNLTSSLSSPSPAISLDANWEQTMTSPPTRDGPLHRLKELQLPILTALPLSDYSRILEHCPKIDTFSVVPLVDSCVPVIAELAPSVKKHCKLIRHVRINRTTSWWYDWDPYLILDGLDSPLESFQIEFYDEGLEEISKDRAISSFHQHSSSLKDIRLLSCERLSDEVIQSILGTCVILERLELSDRLGRQAVANLSKLVACRWVCTGLKHLRITIDWGQFTGPTPPHLPADYLRQSNSPSPPKPLSEQDKVIWEQLEKLYKQIGSLIHLEVLELSVYFGRMSRNPYQPSDQNVESPVHIPTLDTSFRSPDRLPLLLSLGVHASGRCGYLSWLSGLKNLKELRGSVHLGNPENAMTLRQPELEWMVEHWPKLRVLELLPYQVVPPVRIDNEDYAHVDWLLKRKPGLDLRRRWQSLGESWDGLWSQDELDQLMAASS